MTALEEQGIDHETLVFFSSDNGGPPNSGSSSPFRAIAERFSPSSERARAAVPAASSTHQPGRSSGVGGGNAGSAKRSR